MSTLKTNNFEHLDASSPNITLGIGGGVNISGITTVESGIRVSSGSSIGIGATNPTLALHVYHPTNNNVALFESGDAFTTINLADSNGSVSLTTTLGKLRFNVGGDGASPGSNASTAMSIRSNGYVGVGTDVPVENVSVAGTIRVQDSTDVTQYLTINHQGIDFQNTGASSAAGVSAHLLDDYEEGSFTPTLEGGTAYSRQDGFYTKVGSQVYFYIRVEASSATGNTNRWQIFGLPYASSSTDSAYGGAFRNYGDHLTGSNFPDLNFHITTNSTGIRAYNGQTTLLSNNSNINLGRQIILQGFYRTDS